MSGYGRTSHASEQNTFSVKLDQVLSMAKSKRLNWYPSKVAIYATQCKTPNSPMISVHLPSSYISRSSERSTFLLHLVLLSVERTPDTSHTLVQTLNLLRLPLELLAACIAQQQGLLQNLVGLHVAHADRLLFSADVFALEDGVAAGSGRDRDFDLRVGAGEVFEVGFEEVAEVDY
jgi:hypothetical protein